jgi:transcriptional regulator with GAF, ATPase, and Fis domain
MSNTKAPNLEELAAGISVETFAGLLEPLVLETLLEGFNRVYAHEGTIWLADRAEEFLVPVYNSGPRAAQFVGTFRQPLNQGVISMVFASEQPFLETNMAANARRSKLLDSLLEVQTAALMAAPLYLLKQCRGVISCVQLENGPKLPGFTGDDLNTFVRGVTLCSRLVEHQILSGALNR